MLLSALIRECSLVMRRAIYHKGTIYSGIIELASVSGVSEPFCSCGCCRLLHWLHRSLFPVYEHSCLCFYLRRFASAFACVAAAFVTQ